MWCLLTQLTPMQGKKRNLFCALKNLFLCIFLRFSKVCFQWVCKSCPISGSFSEAGWSRCFQLMSVPLQFKITESLHHPFHANHLQSCPQWFKGMNWHKKSSGAHPSLESWLASHASHASDYRSTSLALTEAGQKWGILFSHVS